MSSLPKRFPDRVEIAGVRAEAEGLEPGQERGEQRRLAGRVLARRDMGKLVFLDLVDRSGRIQLLVREEQTGPVDLDLGDIVGVTGIPARTRRGEPSLAVESLTLLAKIRRPLPDLYHGLQDVETRYRQRYLDLLANEESRRDALVRTRMVTEIRRYLDEAGFVEVETPILQPRYGGAFAEPFVTHYNALDADYYLRIADELNLKRLIVGGLEKVYEIGKDFRNEGTSYKHQPEFTMLEWYEAYADYRDTMARMEELIRTVAERTIGTTKVTFRGHEVDLSHWRRIKLLDALEEHGLWTRDEEELRRLMNEREVDTRNDRTWAQLVDHALSHFVEPSLIEPTILHDYPIELSPFARTTDDDPTIVERFEYFVGGMELGNAFTELNDSEEQAQRFAMQTSEREAGAKETEAGDTDYVEALAYGMPPTGGLGLGIDRLAMVLSGRDTIRDVVLFPALRERSGDR
jgi:lysyl-tRNA synthetase class 2